MRCGGRILPALLDVSRVTAGSQSPRIGRLLWVTKGHEPGRFRIREDDAGVCRTRADTSPPRFGTVRPRLQIRVRRGCISSRRHFKTSPSTTRRSDLGARHFANRRLRSMWGRRVMACSHRNLCSQSGGGLGFLSISCWRYQCRADASGGLVPTMLRDPRNSRRCNVLSLLWMPVARDDRFD